MSSMGQAVNTHVTHALTANGVTASVRSLRRPESSGGARWVVWGRRLSARHPGDLPALAFSARGREPSFYLGLCGPLLRSVHQGGIAYPGGLRPTGPAQNFNGRGYPFHSPYPNMLGVMEESSHPVGGVDYPRTLAEFDAWFSSERDCEEYLCRLRWPRGFECPACGAASRWQTGRGAALLSAPSTGRPHGCHALH